MAKIILLRHGQSLWNLQNKFTGWVDIPLSENGRKEALEAAEKIKNEKIDAIFTSHLTRAHETLNLAMSKSEKTIIYVHEDEKEFSWSKHKRDDNEIAVMASNLLNERYYGDLQGKNKKKTAEEFGEEQVHIWRRSYDVAPPNGESLKDTEERTIPYFKKSIELLLKSGKNVLVVAHGNSLRSIVKYIENMTPEEILKFELPTGKPLVYEAEEKDNKVVYSQRKWM